MSRIVDAVNAPFAPVRAYFRKHRIFGIFVGVVLLSIALPLLTRVPPFDGIQSTNAWVNAFTTAAIYAMLAMGLNVVIGFAGLLDLGYAAFFALGFQSGLKAFTAAVLGGIGNTAGAALGGFLIAFIEVGASAFGYGRWGGAVVFSLLVIFLVFRPTGLLGSHTGDRA